jgi:hypothetical protein
MYGYTVPQKVACRSEDNSFHSNFVSHIIFKFASVSTSANILDPNGSRSGSTTMLSSVYHCSCSVVLSYRCRGDRVCAARAIQGFP